MSYVIIPLQAVPNQSFSCVLDGQMAFVTVRTTDYGVFADVAYNGVVVARGRLCEDRSDINPNRYLGLPQFLGFADTQGGNDPVFTGFGSRYLLVYGNPPTQPDEEPPALPVPPLQFGWGYTYGENYGSPAS